MMMSDDVHICRGGGSTQEVGSRIPVPQQLERTDGLMLAEQEIVGQSHQGQPSHKHAQILGWWRGGYD